MGNAQAAPSRVSNAEQRRRESLKATGYDTRGAAREAVRGALPEPHGALCNQFMPPTVLTDQRRQGVASAVSGRLGVRNTSLAPTAPTQLALRKAPTTPLSGTDADGSSNYSHASDLYTDWATPHEHPSPEDVGSTVLQNEMLSREVATLRATVARHEEGLQLADHFRRNSFQ